ncbi:acetyl-CoA synthetase [Lewinella marina]|uniref:Acetate--CoA ligase n=1 Tax=Neolewinella marina TaxID=438751 RepID=A0A2G0CIP8_9BACT|nr:acetate--CoA ligase [Neolewinella marina]NJB85023.1 acetyl-CoA synthetase [Neolewinella marina]PHK99828.1 acetate--CoA ligase [Neolewinella marina]
MPNTLPHQITSFDEYREVYQRSVDDPEAFWAAEAATFTWQKPWDEVLSWNFTDPEVRWFSGGKLNITENCLDRHLVDRGDQVAILFEPNEPGDEVVRLTYRQLHARVCQVSNALRELGVAKGDRVCFYMPMVPELAVSVLACARIGAVHSVVFAGFSAQALADRVNDADCKVIICSDYNRRGRKNIPVKEVVDEALAIGCPSVETVLVHRNTGEDVAWDPSYDCWFHEAVDQQPTDCPPQPMDAEDVLFILYTSGSTGKPKGVVHTCGGYMVYTAYTFRNVFQYSDGDVYWCTADIGWITGHSYILYGPLLCGATTMMFEGVPTYPDAGRFWKVCEKHGVNQFYTAPTALRALMAQGDDFVEGHDLSALKVIGSVGEPINEEAWEWYHEKVGKGQVPIVDTWWQTETGGIMISGLGGLSPQKATFAGYPLPGIQMALVDKNTGEELTANPESGLLCVKFPWPGILRTTWGDHERCRNTYFSTVPGMYFTGDGARRDKNGMYRIVGRVDDVINVSGHRMGTAEVENAIDEHPLVVETAVVGYPHEIKGQGIYAYVILSPGQHDADRLREEIIETVRHEIGPIAKPDKIQFVEELPKTRSGKIMRRILRKVASGETDGLGDTSTLLNPEAVESITRGRI